MPNTKSAKKALRQSERKRVINLQKKRGLLKTLKDYRKSIEEGDKEGALKKLPTVYKILDKAAKTNLIKKNKASRLKSRLTKKLTNSNQAPQAPIEITPEITLTTPED
ncbi:MAG: 30S ribosomal protein S20 [Candidatus Colwellbacteria bacterium CG10_big_fil_rev_8_21_14_0_10_42_22]|uniref:Small ribosomal subunit protein bS20 n=1 Tax=Candidatus Colwellbacteria bacterium CG10_big_fil_rev_8_21_14_0_10_42_22 TaxID=1974540 RepID=A0A2H0VFW0_9BACT|nr:MAG: 30S ribosomal protein S20 [Candidatus Colwellbacteria bacterium CG10_big_fil_rev_8_21_14_0_10_42_22]